MLSYTYIQKQQKSEEKEKENEEDVGFFWNLDYCADKPCQYS